MDTVDTYLNQLRTMLDRISREDIRAVVTLLEKTWESAGTIFIIGNGGSAATASHMMNDLNKMTRVSGLPRVRALALTDNVPLMTALANDQEYADVFAEPLSHFLREGDVLLAISCSGNSPNVVRAVELARSRGNKVVGLCGDSGGRLAALADIPIIVPAPHIGQQEDGHLILNHVMACALAERIQARQATAGAQTYASDAR
jgi:D-sedoheptulose 7-phosphate isomerase